VLDLCMRRAHHETTTPRIGGDFERKDSAAEQTANERFGLECIYAIGARGDDFDQGEVFGRDATPSGLPQMQKKTIVANGRVIGRKQFILGIVRLILHVMRLMRFSPNEFLTAAPKIEFGGIEYAICSIALRTLVKKRVVHL